MKPMLSGKAEELTKIKFPVMVSPKLDGIRALVINGVVCSRNLKAIPNYHVQQLFGHLEGYDGELIVGKPTDADCFRNTTSGVMSRDGEPDVMFHVFDRWNLESCWSERFNTIIEHLANDLVKVPHNLCFKAEDIIQWEEQYLASGYEGVMIRDPNGPYKQGRSTAREGWLLKLKRFEDSEAIILGMEERMHNANEATTNALGHTERSSHQANLVGTGTMGALMVRDIKTGVEFNIGTGFDDAERSVFWRLSKRWEERIQNNGGIVRVFDNSEPEYMIVKYRYFPSGSKDKPRFPTYLGLRDPADM